MTLIEKREACLCELLSAMRQIEKTANSLDHAKWIAASAIRNSNVIAKEGRIPDLAETLAWVKRQKAQGAIAPSRV